MHRIFAKVDDKHLPLYRVLWVSDVPHFCGSEQCEVEGRYEIRLEADESAQRFCMSRSFSGSSNVSMLCNEDGCTDAPPARRIASLGSPSALVTRYQR